jgi:MFS family permease
VVLGACFVAAGVAIGFVETAETAAVALLAPEGIRGSAFGVLAAIQSIGNFAASAVAGVLWTAVSPTVAMLYAAGWMVLALGALAVTRSRDSHTAPRAPKHTPE